VDRILASAQAQFPKSANKTVVIERAWRPYGDSVRPAANGAEGWIKIGQPATYGVARRLQDEGYTWVNLYTGGTSSPFKDVPLSKLI
jgi:hypothetical protein